MSYAEQLKKPQWQKKRLEILERDKWTCQMCGDTEATLTVHHKSYKMISGKFVNIWEYGDGDLITFCEDCHSEEEKALNELKSDAYFTLRDCCDGSVAMDEVLFFLRKTKENTGRRITALDAIKMVEGIKEKEND